MLRLSAGQRRMLVDKVPDAANLALGALFFGQFLGGQSFSISLAMLGIGMWMALMAWALILASEEKAS